MTDLNLAADPRLQVIDMDFYRNSFVTGHYNDARLKIAYYFRPDDGHLLASVNTGRYASGPPGFVHGGAISAMLDETLGVMAWFNKHPVFTANLNVDFLKPLPLEQKVVIDTWIESTQERKVFACGEIISAGEVYARARGLFIRMALETFPDEIVTRLKVQYKL